MKLPWRRKKEQDVLVCVNIDEEHVELSEIDVCRDCGQQVWVSPTGREMQQDKNLKLICKKCVAELMETTDQWALVEPPSPEQLAELISYFKGRDHDR